MKIIIAELPWLDEKGKEYKFGGRSGMRWAYTTKKEPILSFRPFPFSLAYASAILKKAGHEVIVLDCLANNTPYDQFIQNIDSSKPNFLLAETHTPSYLNDCNIARKIKEVTPETKIIFCGPHASALPDDVLKENEGIVDFVVVGEYEQVIQEIVEVKVTSKKVIVNSKEEKSIDSYPWPDREGFNPLKYNETFCDNYPNIHIMASRGCPYQCGYCNCFIMSGGRRIRYRNPLDVVEEMKYCIEKFNPREFWFEDDNINANEQKFKELMSTIHQAELGIPFKAMGHMKISRSALELFKLAGGNGLKLGVESVDNDVLLRLKKGITFDMIQKTLQNCKELGIKTHLTYCIGLPGDTEETIKKTIAFAKNNGTQYQISIAAPFPGTPLFEEAKKEGWLTFKSWNDFDGLNDSIINYPNLPGKRIYQLYQEGQQSTYRKILLNGEWKKYLRMIYQERGLKGILKLARRTDILLSLFKR